MLDIKYIRENPDKVRQGIINKNEKDRFDEVLALDLQRRDLITETEELKAKRNQGSAQVPQIKKAGGDATALLAEMKTLSDKITQNDLLLGEVEEKLTNILMYIPNLPHESVPVGRTAEENVETKVWVPDGFTFEHEEKVLDHVELGKKLKILDFERGAKISGSGFPLYMGKGATLERALINFMLDTHIHKHGYSEIFPPFLVNRDSMKGTGQLPKMEDDMYFMEKDDLFLVPTAEVPVTNIHRNEILNDAETSQYIWGVGFHWYEDWRGGTQMFDNVKRVHESFPTKNLMFTEGCIGPFKMDSVYDWSLGEKYGNSMINDFNNGTVGWTDWNILLDETGGPNHVKNFCFAPVHADTKTGKLIYANSYYYIGHFSKFIRPGAKRITSAPSRSSLITTAFQNTDGKIVVVVMNPGNEKIPYYLWMAKKAALAISLPHSISTLVVE